MASTVLGFLARKNTIYKDQKRMHEILGQGRLLECKWFHQMDMWYRLKATVKNQTPTSSTKKDEINLSFGKPSKLISKPPKPNKKTILTKINKLEGFLEQVITNLKKLMATFQATSTLLKNMDEHMATFV